MLRSFAAASLAFCLRLCVLAQENAPPPLITTAAELRTLSPDAAADGVPVRIRGVVTQIEPDRTIFVQDDTAGTFVRMRKHLPAVRPGQRVEVEGVSYPGLYLPGIEPQTLTVLGEGALPAPRPADIEQLAAGILNYEWVEVRGIVRAFRVIEDGRGLITLGMGNGRFEVLCNTAAPEDGARLVDAAVRVAGLAAGFINDRRQLVAPHLRVNDLGSFHIEQPAPDDPFSLPATSAAKLLQFSPTGRPGHRVKVRGVVLHQERDTALFLRDEEQGLRVETAQGGRVRPGDEVEAVGFAEMGTFSAVLRDAIFRVVGRGTEPAPLDTSVATILSGGHDANLVHLRAELLDVLRSARGTLMLLRVGEVAFRARLAGPDAATIARLRPQSLLHLTGVAMAEQPEFQTTGFRTHPSSFELLLRHRNDVTVLRAGPWWTPTRRAILYGTLIFIASAAIGWVALLRQQVHEQTAIIAHKVKAEAATEERERIAREFHDTLEQELVGLALRLDAAASKVDEPKPRALLDGARRLVQNVQSGARALVWDLRERALDELPLPEAISHAVSGLRTGRIIDVHADGEPRRLPRLVEHELLRIAQEATTNAVKHGDAARIHIDLAFADDTARLRIRDDGHGFDPLRDGVKPGHFGLLGMRERIMKLGGTFTLQSAPGSGTLVEVSAPLEPASTT